MPLPLAMMIPFMGIQSAVMAKQFGENFQYGKRRISAMSNDEFNKLTPKMIQDNANAELKAMIPSMQESITDMRQFQEFMIKEMLRTIGDMLRNGLGFLLGIGQSDVEKSIQDIEHFLHGHFDLHTGQGGTTTTEPPPAPPPPVTDEPEPLPLGTQAQWLINNATGRVIFRNASGVNQWVIDSRISGVWTKIKNYGTNLTLAITEAIASWPNHKQFGVKLTTSGQLDSRTTIFWYVGTLPT